jgi:hypothetical protein
VATLIESATEMQRVESIVQSLHSRLGAHFDAAVIAAEVESEFAAYSTARITQFVPILVESRVWARLCQQRSAQPMIQLV